jgi:competence protein ComGC
MIIRKMKRASWGFTIIELMIATTVFSTVLLLAMTGFFQIGHIFYKGVSVTQTQDVTNQIGFDVTSSVEGATKVSALTSYKGMQYICIGKNRYTIDTSHRVDLGNTSALSNGVVGIVKDTMNSDNACAPPCLPNPSSCASGELAWNKPNELLGDNMKAEVFSVAPVTSVSSNYYNVSLVVSYGADDLINYTTPGDRSTATCGLQKGGQFCSVGHYSASVNRGLGD